MKASFEILTRETLPWEGDLATALGWVSERLVELGLAKNSTIKDGDRQTTLNVNVFNARYRLHGLTRDCLPNSMILRLHKPSALLDKLQGRAPFDDSDPFARVLQEMLEREAALVGAKVDTQWR